MATRFYLPSSGAAPASPAVDSFWDITDPNFSRFKAVTTKITSSMIAHTLQEDTPADVDQDWVFAQWISEPLAAQTISAQTVEIQMRGRETASGNNMFLAWSIRVCSNDGSTIRGTLVAGNRDATELGVSSSTLTNRRDTATSSSLTVEAGDRIIIEIGTGGNPNTGATHSSTISYGDDSGTDLPENDTETAANNPWVEFPNTITFLTAYEVTVSETITATEAKNNDVTVAQSESLSLSESKNSDLAVTILDEIGGFGGLTDVLNFDLTLAVGESVLLSDSIQTVKTPPDATVIDRGQNILAIGRPSKARLVTVR